MNLAKDGSRAELEALVARGKICEPKSHTNLYGALVWEFFSRTRVTHLKWRCTVLSTWISQALRFTVTQLFVSGNAAFTPPTR